MSETADVVNIRRIPDAPPDLNMLQRAVWYAQRLREAGIPFDPTMENEELAGLYHSHYYADGYPPPDRPPGTHSWTPIDLVAAALEPPDPPTIGGIVYPGRRHVFSGEPESLKSWAVLCLTVDELAQQHTVIYIDFEMGRRDTIERLHALGAADQQISDHLIYLEPDEPMTAPHVLPDVQDTIETRRPTLVVIDAFTGALALHGYDPNVGVDVERFYTTVVDVLRARDAAVVILDHLVKDKEQRGKFSIGSERKIGAADVHLRFDVIDAFGRGLTGKAKLDVKKDRPGYLPRPRAAELELVSNPDTHAITWTIAIAETTTGEERRGDLRPTHLMEKISRYLETLDEPVSRKHLLDNVEGNAKYKRKAIGLLIREGYATEESGARNARLARTIRPYREAADTQKNDLVPHGLDMVPAQVIPPGPPGPPPYGGDQVDRDQDDHLFEPDLVPLHDDLGYLGQFAPDEDDHDTAADTADNGHAPNTPTDTAPDTPTDSDIDWSDQ